MLYLGLDLGLAGDYSALSIIDKKTCDIIDPETGKKLLDRHGDQLTQVQYQLTYLKRWPLFTPYTQVAYDVGELVKGDAFWHRAWCLTTDATGVGVAVLELLQKAELRPTAVTITAGSEENQNPVTGNYNVPKKNLVVNLLVLAEGKEFKIASGIDEYPVFEKELNVFRMKMTAAGNEQFEALHVTDHDDLVLSVALAAWRAKRGIADEPKKETGWEQNPWNPKRNR